MSSSNLMLISIPPKRTVRHDLEASILKVVSEKCGPDVASERTIKNAAQALDEKRHAACLSVLVGQEQHGGPNAASLAGNVKYINALSRVAHHAEHLCLPSGRTAGVDEFEWRDAFTTVPCKTSQYKLEIVACTINCANLTAALANRKTFESGMGEDELMEASKMYRKAAGFYDYLINDMTYQVAGGTPDLHSPCHTACKFAMLANAQGLLYRSAMKPEHRYPAVIQAKIAAGTHEMYEVVVRNCQTQGIRDSPIAKRLVPPAKILSLFFDAEAELGMADVCEKAAIHEAIPGKFGEYMARCRKACLALQHCESMLGSLPPGSDEARIFPGEVRRLLHIARDKLNVAIESNRNYHEEEPATNALPRIEPLIRAQPFNVGDQFTVEEVFPAIEPLVRLASP